jgi:hypothetical protein
VISALFAFFHFLAVFGIFAAVVLQWQTMSPTPSLAEARRIQTSDRWFGAFAVVVLVVGFLRVYHFEKGKAFYASNPFFQAKLALFPWRRAAVDLSDDPVPQVACADEAGAGPGARRQRIQVDHDGVAHRAAAVAGNGVVRQLDGARRGFLASLISRRNA